MSGAQERLEMESEENSGTLHRQASEVGNKITFLRGLHWVTNPAPGYLRWQRSFIVHLGKRQEGKARKGKTFLGEEQSLCMRKLLCGHAL